MEFEKRLEWVRVARAENVPSNMNDKMVMSALGRPDCCDVVVGGKTYAVVFYGRTDINPSQSGIKVEAGAIRESFWRRTKEAETLEGPRFWLPMNVSEYWEPGRRTSPEANRKTKEVLDYLVAQPEVLDIHGTNTFYNLLVHGYVRSLVDLPDVHRRIAVGLKLEALPPSYVVLRRYENGRKVA